MKKLTLLAAILCSLLSFKSKTSPTNEELITTAKVLMELSDEAARKNKPDKVFIYYNAYRAIRDGNNFSSKYDPYFNEIKNVYSSTASSYQMKVDYPPKLISSNNNGGFNHSEIELMRNLINSKMNKTNLQDVDLNKIKSLQDKLNQFGKPAYKIETLKNLNLKEKSIN